MKNLVFKVLVLAGIVTILTGCPGLLFTYGDDIVLQNRTSSCIRCYETSFSKEYKKSYKDTAIHFSPESGLLEIQGGSFFINNTFAHTLEEFFEGIPCDTLMFFILREHLCLIISDIEKYRYKNNRCKKQGEKAVL